MDVRLVLDPDERQFLDQFAAEPGKPAFGEKDVLAFQRRPLKSGVQTVTVTVDRTPAFAGVDPYNKWIDRESDDNVQPVDQAS